MAKSNPRELLYPQGYLPKRLSRTGKKSEPHHSSGSQPLHSPPGSRTTQPTSRIQVKQPPLGEKTMLKESLTERLRDILSQVVLEESAKGTIEKELVQLVSEENLRNKLELLFEYEKHYLELIKDYKEEIKFSASLQEDLRRERSQFFTQILREVSETLKKADVDSKVASQWTQDLVDSYTKSIELSGDLAKTHAIDVIGKLRESTKAIEKSLIGKNEEQVGGEKEE